MILGVIGLVIPFLGVFGIIFGAATIKEKPNAKAITGLILGIISFLFLPIFIVIIILSMSTARDKAREAKIKSDLHEIHTQAEVYYSMNNSYKDFQISENILNDFESYNQNRLPDLKINTDGTNYVLIVELKNGNLYCIDPATSFGQAQNIDGKKFICNPIEN